MGRYGWSSCWVSSRSIWLSLVHGKANTMFSLYNMPLISRWSQWLQEAFPLIEEVGSSRWGAIGHSEMGTVRLSSQWLLHWDGSLEILLSLPVWPSKRSSQRDWDGELRFWLLSPAQHGAFQWPPRTAWNVLLQSMVSRCECTCPEETGCAKHESGRWSWADISSVMNALLGQGGLVQHSRK